MGSIDLAAKILSSVWAIDTTEGQKLMPLVSQIVKGKSLSFAELRSMRESLKAKTQPLIATYSVKSESYYFEVSNKWDIAEAPNNSIAIIRISGVIFGESGDCNKGINEYANEIRFAGSNPNIKGVLIEMNSPGGDAFGPESLANLIANFEDRYKKPIAALINGQASSAGYAIISNAPKIFISGNMSQAGSIGVVSTIHNYEGWMEKEGIKEYIYRATDSFNKNQAYLEASEGNPEKLMAEILDPINKGFKDLVNKGRGDLLNKILVNNPANSTAVPEVFTGKVYFGEKVIEMGLADEMGDRDDALNYLVNASNNILPSQDSNSNNDNFNNNSTNQQSMKNTFGSRILAFFKNKGLQLKTQDGENASEEDIDLEELEIALNEQAVKDEVQAQVAEKTKTLEAQIESLQKSMKAFMDTVDASVKEGVEKALEEKSFVEQSEYDKLKGDVAAIKTGASGGQKSGDGKSTLDGGGAQLTLEEKLKGIPAFAMAKRMKSRMTPEAYEKHLKHLAEVNGIQ